MNLPVFSKIDSLIRLGKISDATTIIKSLDIRKLARGQRGELATLARRSSMAIYAIKLLRPYVHPSSRKFVQTTDEERLEYAASLSFLGASKEALSLLSEVDSSQHPSSLLYSAFSLFAQWDYASSLQYLEQYCQNSNLNDYQKLVGKANLAAVYVHEKIEEKGHALLEELERECLKEGHQLLLNNIYQMRAELLIIKRDFSSAQAALNKAKQQMESCGGIDELFFKKWEAVVDAYKNKDTKRLKQTAQHAIKIGHWETIRDCDYHRMVACQDEKLFYKLFYGTPHEAYRSRLKAEANWLSKIDQRYSHPLNKSKGTKIVISAINGANSINDSFLKSNTVPQRTLQTLLSDLYRPWDAISLHAALFPDYFYNPDSSSNLIKQAIFRLNEHFANYDLPLSARSNIGGYLITTESPVNIEYQQNCEDAELSRLCQEIRDNWEDTAIRIKDFMAYFDISRRTASYRIKWLQENNKLKRIKSGKESLYFLKKE